MSAPDRFDQPPPPGRPDDWTAAPASSAAPISEGWNHSPQQSGWASPPQPSWTQQPLPQPTWVTPQPEWTQPAQQPQWPTSQQPAWPQQQPSSPQQQPSWQAQPSIWPMTQPAWQPWQPAVATVDPRLQFDARRRLTGWLIAAAVMLAFTVVMWLFTERVFYLLPAVAILAAGRAIAEYRQTRPRLG